MFEHFISNLWWNSSFWYLRCLKRGEMSIFSSFSWIMSFSSTFEKLSSFLYCRRIPTSLEYPWFVLVLIYSSQIFRGATHQSRREIWCPPQEQGPHRGPCPLMRSIRALSILIDLGDLVVVVVVGDFVVFNTCKTKFGRDKTRSRWNSVGPDKT